MTGNIFPQQPGGSGDTTSTYITFDDETTTLTNSRQILAGSNITFNSATPGELTISASVSGGGGGAVFDTWDTAGRPGSPVTGQVGYNTDFKAAEFYDGTEWASIPYIATESSTIFNGSYTALLTDSILEYTGDTNTDILTLPSTDIPNGKIYWISADNIATPNYLTIDGDGNDIEGLSDVRLGAGADGSYPLGLIYVDSGNWRAIGSLNYGLSVLDGSGIKFFPAEGNINSDNFYSLAASAVPTSSNIEIVINDPGTDVQLGLVSTAGGATGQIAVWNDGPGVGGYLSLSSSVAAKWNLISESANFSVNDPSMSYYRVDTSGGAVTATLPASPADGSIYKFKTLSASFDLTIDADGAELIDNAGISSEGTLVVASVDGVVELVAISGGWDVT